MKKQILLLTSVLFSTLASAQFTVWEDDFNDGEAADWTLLDVDGNTSNWLARKDLQLDSNTGGFTEGTVNVLANYNIDFANGTFYPASENNWAITPAQDLSYYAGTVQLAITAQTSVYGGNQDYQVYISNTPEIASFLETTPININLTRLNDEGTEFHENIIDLSQYAGAGQPEVYIAIAKTGQFLGVEIDNIKITATDIAGVDVVTKTATKIKQNPVTETLELQPGSAINADALTLQVYNMNGMLVKEERYNHTDVMVSDLAGGMYIVVINDGMHTEHLKFIKK